MTAADAPPLLLGFPDYRRAGEALASTAGFNYAEVEVHRFPDEECRIRLPSSLPERVIFCRSLDRPDRKLVELIIAASAARELGAKNITLVAPYLCYMRQDTAFHPGEAVSQQIIGRLLANYVDELVTVDPHLHRVHSLDKAVPVQRSQALTATGVMADFLAGRLTDPLLLGPDEESKQWVEAIAAVGRYDYAVAHKQRTGDRQVQVHLPDIDCRGRNLVLVDDVASSGHTLLALVQLLKEMQPASIAVMVTHALFADPETERRIADSVDEIWSTDSIPHSSNCIGLSSLLATALLDGN